MTSQSRRVYEIHVPVGKDAQELQEVISSILCPDPDHEPPCPVPWATAAVGTRINVGLYATEEEVDRLLVEITTVAKGANVTLHHDVDPAGYQELIQQYEIEAGLR
ncbi:hypothetical protein [Streptomyces wuyuanensis]|uniref:hypothetical protein n=1 Tax=Streptomyces wuyuanensis TaxID=1196353 RepID=UPI0037141458